jgi:hypothetical protein
VDETPEEPRQNNKPQVMDEIFSDSRLKIEAIITLLAEKLQMRVEKLLEEPDGVEKLGPYMEHLERLVFLNQMNKAKVRDLAHLAPAKYRKLVNDADLIKKLRPVRDEVNFPKRGPPGPREDVAPPSDDGE